MGHFSFQEGGVKQDWKPTLLFTDVNGCQQKLAVLPVNLPVRIINVLIACHLSSACGLDV
jgi:hypothetical protein